MNTRQGFSCNRHCSPCSDRPRLLLLLPPQDHPRQRKQATVGRQASAQLARQTNCLPSCSHQPLYLLYRQSPADHSCSSPSFTDSVGRRGKGEGVTGYSRSVPTSTEGMGSHHARLTSSDTSKLSSATRSRAHVLGQSSTNTSCIEEMIDSISTTRKEPKNTPSTNSAPSTAPQIKGRWRRILQVTTSSFS